MSSESKPLPTSSALSRAFSRKRVLGTLRPFVLTGLVAAIVMKIVALSPTSVEDGHDASHPIEPNTLIPREKVTLAPGIPKNVVPEYTVDGFNYVSTHGSVRDWNLLADHAYLYDHEKLVHARQVKAFLYDPDGKVTTVTGQEAKYLMSSPTAKTSTSSPPGSKKVNAPDDGRDLEVYGNVITTFPDGFEVHSEYMHYLPSKRIIEIPSSYEVSGRGQDSSGQELSFTSQGMNYSMKDARIVLNQAVKVRVEKDNPNAPGSKNQAAGTLIESDHCVIEREKQIAHFTMNRNRPLKSRFVYVTQPTLFSKGRWGILNYGNLQKTNKSTSPAEPDKAVVNYIVLHDDVLLKETGKGSLRYATAGEADFNGQKDIVTLTQFPQVYEGEDTVTGDKIILHRDTDVVEVEHSNSFSEGQTNP